MGEKARCFKMMVTAQGAYRGRSARGRVGARGAPPTPAVHTHVKVHLQKRCASNSRQSRSGMCFQDNVDAFCETQRRGHKSSPAARERTCCRIWGAFR